MSFDKPSCCIRFACRKACTFFFIDIDDFKYTFILPNTTVSKVIFNNSWVILNYIYETFALYEQTAKRFSLFVNINYYKYQ